MTFKQPTTKFAPAERAPDEIIIKQSKYFQSNEILNNFLSKRSCSYRLTATENVNIFRADSTPNVLLTGWRFPEFYLVSIRIYYPGELAKL